MEPRFYKVSIHVFYAVGTAFAVTLYILTLKFEATLGIPIVLFLIGSGLLVAMPWIAAGFKLIWANIFFALVRYRCKKLLKVNKNDSGIKSSIRNSI